MFDKKLYTDTFSKLKTSEDTLTEVMKMTTLKRRPPARAILVASILAIAFVTTAFAYGGAIIQFMFGDNSAQQVESMRNPGDSHGFEIVNRLPIPEIDLSEGRNHSSFDEVRAIVPFDVREPAYMPHDGSWNINIMDAYTVYATFLPAHTGVASIDENTAIIYVFQYYAGPDAYINLTSANPIEKVLVGELEATTVFDGVAHYLYFTKNGVIFEIHSTGYDVETLIAIAESL